MTFLDKSDSLLNTIFIRLLIASVVQCPEPVKAGFTLTQVRVRIAMSGF